MTKFLVIMNDGCFKKIVNDEAYDSYYNAIVALVDDMYKYSDVEDFGEILENTLYEAEYNPDFVTFLGDWCYYIEQIEDPDED